MEPNLRFWISERQSFIQRFLQWTELLDPTNLIISDENIEKWRHLLLDEDASRDNAEDQKMQEAWKRSLSTVHPDSSKLIPVLFRPAAFLPATWPMFFLYTYTTAFNIINGNASYSHHPQESLLLGTGVMASSTFFGIIPHLVKMKLSSFNNRASILIGRVLPIVFLAQVSGMNVMASRSFEPVRGIEVMDKEGKVIGHSRRAGEKAVRDTALSRTVLFGTSAFIPEVFTHLFRRTQFFLQHPWSLWTVKLSSTILVMGLMVPASFSMFPQMGRIQSSKLEEEIQSSTEEAELFYHRGV
ncbi:sideroflexin-4 isoform X2 [Tamandua tetradactyla]|uniref:sideroflexin-4 isoform X2 n=1 Tax=Tamandua tetradactyla TaxID=48850 RepID=UPI004053BAFE